MVFKILKIWQDFFSLFMYIVPGDQNINLSKLFLGWSESFAIHPATPHQSRQEKGKHEKTAS
jgi:hypothetical protein